MKLPIVLKLETKDVPRIESNLSHSEQVVRMP